MVGAMNVSLLLEQQVQTCRTYKMKGTHAQEKLNKKNRQDFTARKHPQHHPIPHLCWSRRAGVPGLQSNSR